MATPVPVLYEDFQEEEEHPRSPKETMPTMYDLPDEEVGQSGMPDNFHVWQARLLDETFRPPNYERGEIFTGSDLNVYYNIHDTLQNKRPDWFAVVGLPKKDVEIRRSYVIWQEGPAPLIVVELLSPSTRKDDLGQRLRDVASPPTKWEVYERWLRVPYYITFDRRTDDLRVFRLSAARYEEMANLQGMLWVKEVELGLGLWQGRYQDLDRLWLRWHDRAGNWLPTPTEESQQERERAEQERERAEQERQRAEQERGEKEAALQRAEQLAAKLRALGIDPDQP